MSTFQSRSDAPLPPAPVVSERDRALRLLRELREEEQRSDIAAPSHNGILLPKHDDGAGSGSVHGLDSWTTKLGGATAGVLRAGAALADHHQLSSDLPAVRGAEPRPPASGAASSARSSVTAAPSAAGSRLQRDASGNGCQTGRARSVPALPPGRHGASAHHQHPAPAGAGVTGTARRGESTKGRSVQFDPLVALRECIKALLAKPHKYGSVHGVLESEYQYVVQLYTDAASTGDPGVSRSDGRTAAKASKSRTITGPSGKSVSVKENWFDVQMRQGAEGAGGDAGEAESNDGGLTPGVSTLAREITSLRRLLSSAEATRDHYKTMLDRSNQDLRQRDEAIGELEKYVDNAERTELDLKRQNSSLMQELHRLKAELLSLEESRKRDNNLKRRLESQAERRLVEAKTEIGGLYTQLKVINHRYSILEREMGMTAEDRDNFETRFLHATKEADDAYDAVNSRDDRIAGLIGDVDSLAKRYTRLEHAARDVMLFLGRATIHQLLTNPLEGDMETTVAEMIDTAAASSSPPGAAAAGAPGSGGGGAGGSCRVQSPARSIMGRSGFSPRTKDLPNAFDDASAEEERRTHIEGVKRAAAKLLRVARAPGDDTAKLLLISAPTIWRYVAEESTARRRSLCAPHPAVTAACFLYTLRAVGGRTVLATDQTMRALQAAVTGATSAEGKVSALRPLDDSKQLARASGEFWLASLQSITTVVMGAAANQQRALSAYRDAVERKQRAADKAGGVRRTSESGAAAEHSLSSSDDDDDDDSDEAPPEGETIVPANAWRVIVPVSFGPSTFAAAPPASVVLLDADNVTNPPIPATGPRPATTSMLKLAHPSGALLVSDLIIPPPCDGNGVASGSAAPREPSGAFSTPQHTPQAAPLTPGIELNGSAALEAQPPKTATPPTSAPRPKALGANTQAYVSRSVPDPAAWRWAHVAKAALLKKRVTLDDTLRVCTAEALYPQIQAGADPLQAKPFSGLALGQQVAEQRMKNARLNPAEISRFITSLLAQRYAQHAELEAHAVAHGLRRGGGGPLQGFLVNSPLQASTMQKSTEGHPSYVRTPSAAASGDDEPLLPFTAGLEPFNTFVRRFAARRGTPASRHQPVDISKAGKDSQAFKAPDALAASIKAADPSKPQDGVNPDLLDAADAVALDAKVFLGVSEDTATVSMRPPAPANPMAGRAPPPEDPPVATGDAVPLPMSGVELLATVWQQSTELGGGTAGAPLDMDAHLFQLLGRGLVPEQLFVDIFFNLDLLYATCLEAANHQHLDAAKPEADAAVLDVSAAVDLPVFTGILTQQGFLVTTTRPAHISAHGGSVASRGKDEKHPAAPPPLPHRRRLPFTSLELVRMVAAIARDHGATMTSVAVDQILARPTSASADVAAGSSSSPRSAFYTEFVAVLLERFERDRRSFVEDVLLHADCIPDGTGQGRAMTPLPGDASPGITPEKTPAAAAPATADWSKVADRKLAVPQVKARWCDRDPALTPQDIEQLLFALTRPTKKDGFSPTTVVAADTADAESAKDAECAGLLAACGYAKHEIDAAMATRTAVHNAEVAMRKKNAGLGGGKKKKSKADGPDPKGPSQLAGKALAEVVGRTWPPPRAAPATPLATLHAQRHDEWFDILLVDVAAKPAELAITAEHSTQQYAPPKLSALAGPGAIGASPAGVRRASVAASAAASPAPLGARRSSSFHGNFAMESSVEVMPPPCRWQRVMPVDVMDAYHRFDAACQRIATFVPPRKAPQGAAASPQGSPRGPASISASPTSDAIVLMQPDGAPAAKLIPHAKIRGAALPPPPTGAHYDEFSFYLTPRVANLHAVLHRTAKLYAGVFVFDSPAGVTNADDEAASGAATIENVIAEAKRLAETAFRSSRVPGAAAPPVKTPASSKAAKTSGSPQAQRQESKETVAAPAAGELRNPAEEAALASMRRAAMFSARRVVASAPSLEAAFADLLTTTRSAACDGGDGPAQADAPPTLQLTKPQRKRSTSRRHSASPMADGGSPEGAADGFSAGRGGEGKPSMSAAAAHFATAFFKPDGGAKYGVESRPDFRPLLDADDVTALAGMQRGVCLSSYVSAAPDQWRAFALRKVVERGTVSASLGPHASVLQLLGTLNVIGAGRDRRRSTRAGGKNKGNSAAVQALFKAAEARIDVPDPHAHVSLPMTSQLMLRAEYVVQAAPLLASPAPAAEAVMALARIRRSGEEQFPSAHRAYAAAVGGAAGGTFGSNAAESGGSGTGHSSFFKGSLPKDWLSQP